MPTDLLDYLNHSQVLLSFSTGSWADLFGYVLIIEAPIMFLAILFLMAMTGFTLQNKLEKCLFDFYQSFI